MKKYYIEVLEKIEKNGYEAYIVGGFVRDKILGIESVDVDIITNAKLEVLKKIFSDEIKIIYEKYGAIKIEINNHIIDITTFRKELLYKDGQLCEIEYVTDLKEDLKRRDFTINTLCMDKNEKIIDLFNGFEDINNRLIKTVRPVYIELKEDPSRIIRALRFMSVFDFELDKDLFNYIINAKNEIFSIKDYKLKEELNKLFKSGKALKFLEFIKKYDLEEYFGISSENYKETNNFLYAWSQLQIKRNLPFSKKERMEIHKFQNEFIGKI